MTTAIYPGSFDPMTSGHLDVATRAARVFERLLIGVYASPAKSLLFSTEERVAMAEEAVRHLPNVTVAPFAGLLTVFAGQVGARVIIRGLRAVSDFEIEMQLTHMYRRLDPGVEVCCLMTSTEYSHLSASLIKEIAKLGGDPAGMVPAHIAAALREKFAAASAPGEPPRHLGIT